MRTIDVHQHLWPASFVAALRARSSAPCLDGSVLRLCDGAYDLDLGDNDLERRLALLDRHGIDVAVVSLQTTLGLSRLDPAERDELEAAWEDGILALAASSHGRLLPLAARVPRDGFAGACVGAGSFDDLDALAPVLDGLGGSGLLFVHPEAGAPSPGAPGWWPAVADYTAQMQRAWLRWLADGRQRWRDVRVVFAVLAGGGPVQAERLASRGVNPSALRDPSVFLDTASYGPRALRLCAEVVGTEQLVLGTDVPVVDAALAVSALAALGPEVAASVGARAETLLPGLTPGAR